MNCISRVSSYTAAIFGRGKGILFSRSVSHQCYCYSTSTCTPLRNRSFERPVSFDSVKFNLQFVFRFRAQCYSTKKGSAKVSRERKLDPTESATAPMEQEKDAFFVVRKGDVVGVYKSFTDCQAQIGSSVCDPPVSVYKGYSLSKDTEEYLVSRGLQNALYAIRAQDLKEDLFGTLVPCPFQQPDSSKGETSALVATKKRSQEFLGLQIVETDGSASGLTDPLRKHAKLDNQTEAQALYYDDDSCILEFDGASKGNPGPAGAGALLRTTDGRIICRLREGLGQVTNNVAEYRAMILGMKYALKKGYTKIRVQGDSKLVCSQVQGLWKVKHKDMTNLYEQAKQLKDKFASFQISHVLRDTDHLTFVLGVVYSKVYIHFEPP
ncbi:uncharacterized protein LOC8280792 isoform X2 [Ricinus communis]|uniref:uncharacterized protein LOC8280792 isoform X2 n=1 Tax=Ricinus communis TaxID=3988 RepID=UPI00201A43E4|nr:uncharacterized protein LOC8280792 isoform X2 [Ricinus communis]